MARSLAIDLRQPDDALLREGGEVVRKGGVIVYPTETVYGIGTSPYHRGALRRLQQLKRRTEPKPLIVLVRCEEDLASLVREIPRAALPLMKAFWPGPLTLLFPASPELPDEVTQGGGTVGIRIPSSPFCLRLMELAGTPLTSTSANLSGETPLRSISEMIAVFPPGIDLYFDAGFLPPSPSSTVVDVSTGIPSILREGAVSREDLLGYIVPMRD